jgi:hypothetical protein
MLYIVLYLGAAVAANLLVTRFGPQSAPFVAFGLVSLDLTSRDHLHDAWKHKGLWWKMAALIGSGSFLSWLVNRDAGPIALASFVAFGCAGLSDTLTYAVLGDKKYLVRVNGSNVVSAVVDSIVFLSLAFGWPPDWWIVSLQFAAKVLGGLVWSVLLKRSKDVTYLERCKAWYLAYAWLLVLLQTSRPLPKEKQTKLYALVKNLKDFMVNELGF